MYLKKGQELKLVTGQTATVVRDESDYFICNINGKFYSASKEEIGKTAFLISDQPSPENPSHSKKNTKRPSLRKKRRKSITINPEKHETKKNYFTGIEYFDSSAYGSNPVTSSSDAKPQNTASSEIPRKHAREYKPNSMKPPDFAEGTPRMRYFRSYGKKK